MKIYNALSGVVFLLVTACSFNNPFLKDDPILDDDPTTTTYAVTVSLSGAAAGESVTADVSEAAEGTTVTLTAALGSGRQVVLGAAGTTITPSTVNTNGTTASFTMPAQDVGVSAAFSYYAGGSVTHTANAVSFNMHYVPSGGPFIMGEHVESTTQSVTLTKNFWMGETEVTQGLWEDVWGTTWPGTDPDGSGYGAGAHYPAYYVNWFDVVAFCNLLTLSDNSIDNNQQVYYSDAGLTTAYTKSNAASEDAVYVYWSKTGYRLPTEAEWEYAARYIDGTSWNGGDYVSGGPVYTDETDPDKIGDYAWYSGNNSGSSGDLTYGSKEVGQKIANALGLRDMSGNVYEWCYDWFAAYSDGPETDPTGPGSGSHRVIRGGNWVNSGDYLRCAERETYPPAIYGGSRGFRLCRTAD